MGRTRNPAISPLVLVGIGVGAYFLLRGAVDSFGAGDDGLKGSCDVRTFAGVGELFVDGAKVADVGPSPVTVVLPAGKTLTLKVKFADGSESPERRIVLQPSGPASAGGFNPQQLFVAGASSLAAASYRAQAEALTAAGKLEQATAVQRLADAQALVRARQYEQGLAAYAAIVADYPGTPQASAAAIAKGILSAQLATVAGRAALDLSNPV